MSKLTESKEWKALQAHQKDIARIPVRKLFEDDPQRFQRFSCRFNDILFDYSKNHIDQTTIDLLVQLADANGLREQTLAMYRGEPINNTENRSVLHIALRNRSNRPIKLNGKDVMHEVNLQLSKMQHFSDKVRSGEWVGYSGKKITNVVNIGIGGSDLGPKMVRHALKPYTRPDIRCHFVSNMDPTDIMNTISGLNPETTLFLVASKSFTTPETLTNAETAKEWLLKTAQDRRAVCKHFVAMSTNYDAVKQFGIDPENMFEFWDWVGGRYSLWSAVGLSIAVGLGMYRFEELLQGAYEVDEHFRDTPFEQNIPALMGLLGIWNNNFFHSHGHAVMPYDQNLDIFPRFLQQLDMESNGKYVDRDGNPVDYATGPIIWGEAGTNGQHAFFQLLHQGTQLAPCDFMVAAVNHNEVHSRHEKLLANFLAQPEAMMRGKNREQVIEELHASGLKNPSETLIQSKIFPGNRPNSMFIYDKLTAKTLGSLIAFYEHKVFTQGIIWNINSFDQMGVELGKQLANAILPELSSDNVNNQHDSSTQSLINEIVDRRNTLM
ncbi:MAG: glucose-6-phosphate isomerase [Gammaproteobacteria bacterium]|nr:glucose-6-phosphate isomerase [Gammaproteobacteria bacterium]